METELEQLPETTDSTPADSEQGADVETELELDADAAHDGEADAETEEEVEYEGKQYRVPKELKDALLRQSDYTKKTQEVAETRKQIEAARQTFDSEKAFHLQSIEELSNLRAIDSQLKQYAQIDWNALADQDPAQAMKLDRQARELQSLREQTAYAFTQKQAEFQQRQQHETARQLEEGRKVIQREIPDWTPEKAEKLVKYGISRGFSEQMLRSTTDPMVVLALNDLYQYSELRKKATTTPKAVQEKPVTRVTPSKARVSPDPERMSTDEWVKWRNSQLKKPR